MRALAAAAVLFSLMWEVCDAQLMKDTRGDVSPGLPPWVDVVAESIGQSGALLTLELQTAAEIPHRAGDSCAFEFVLRPAARAVTGTDRRKLPSRQIIRFDLSRWDGSPWFSMNAYFYHEGSETPRETSRVFDWKLTQNKLWVRFSLEGSSWSSLEWATRVFYGKNYVDAAPDSGFASFEVRRDSLVGLSSAKGKRSAFVYPSSFEPVLRDNKLTLVADEAYRLERELSGIVPLCGDSVSYIFNPYYGGAAIEGSPIYLGPSMWGNQPAWFVYFHELGHDFCNASARFRQLYPLTIGLPPGPLPFNILFYESWASLPAMYVYEQFMSDSVSGEIPKEVMADIRKDWEKTRKRFIDQWEKYKLKPDLHAINPDIVDGMFLQLRAAHGWGFFKEFYRLMRPQNETLSVLDSRVASDSADLRISRSTLTAALFSALAHKDLRDDFRHWDFPVDDGVFDGAYKSLQHDLTNEPGQK
jgi:hypothetical protein